MTQSIASSLVFYVPPIRLWHHNGQLLCTNEPDYMGVDPGQGKDGTVAFWTDTKISFLRSHLKQQLDSFFTMSGDPKDRTTSVYSTAVSGQVIMGTERSPVYTGDAAASPLYWATPTPSVNIKNGATTTLGDQAYGAYHLPEAVWKSIRGNVYLSGSRVLVFDGHMSPYVTGIAANNKVLNSTATGWILLDDITTGSNQCMVRGSSAHFTSEWEGENPTSANWKRFYAGATPSFDSRYITFLSAEVINADLHIFKLTGISSTHAIDAGQELTWSPASNISLVDPPVNYAFCQGWKVDAATLVDESDGQTGVLYGFAKMANGRIHAPSIFHIGATYAYSVDGDFMLNTNNAAAEASSVEQILSPAYVISQKYAALFSNIYTGGDFTNPKNDETVPDRFKQQMLTDVNEILSPEYIKHNWYGKITDIDYVALRAFLQGYRDYDAMQILCGSSYGIKSQDARQLARLVYDINVPTIIDQNTGRCHWFAAGGAIMDGDLSQDNLVLSYIPRDRDGNKWPLITVGYHKDQPYSGGVVRGLITGDGLAGEAYVVPGGSRYAYNGSVMWLSSSHEIKGPGEDNVIGERIDPKTWDSYHGLRVFKTDAGYSYPGTTWPYGEAYTFKKPLNSDGKMCLEPKGVCSQYLTGTYLGGGYATVEARRSVGDSRGWLIQSYTVVEDGNEVIRHQDQFSANWNEPLTTDLGTYEFPEMNALGHPLKAIYAEVSSYGCDAGENHNIDVGLDNNVYVGETTYNNGLQYRVTINGQDINFTSVASGPVVLGSFETYAYGSLLITNPGTTIKVSQTINKPPKPTVRLLCDDNGDNCSGSDSTFTDFIGYLRILGIYSDQEVEYQSIPTQTYSQLFGGYASGSWGDEFDPDLYDQQLRQSAAYLDKIALTLSQPYEAGSRFSVTSSIMSPDDHFSGPNTLPTQLVFPEKYDGPLIWFGPNCSSNNERMAKLVKLSNGYYAALRHPSGTEYSQTFPLMCPIRTGESKRFYHLGGSISRVYSVREIGGAPPIVTFDQSGDMITVRSNGKKGVDTLIVYDEFNDAPGILTITVTDFVCGFFPDLGDTTSILYFNGEDRYTALRTINSPIVINKNICIGTFAPTEFQAIRITPPEGDDIAANAESITYDAVPSVTPNVTVDKEGEYTVDMHYNEEDAGRVEFTFKSVKLTLSKNLLNITGSQGDTLTVTNAQGVKWVPKMGEFLTERDTTQMIAVDVAGQEDYWSTNDEISWTLTLPPGWKPPASSGRLYVNVVIGQVKDEFVYIFSETFRIDIQVRTTGDGGLTPGGGNSSGGNSINNATSTSQSGQEPPNVPSDSTTYFFNSTTPVDLDYTGNTLNWANPIVT